MEFQSEEYARIYQANSPEAAEEYRKKCLWVKYRPSKKHSKLKRPLQITEQSVSTKEPIVPEEEAKEENELTIEEKLDYIQENRLDKPWVRPSGKYSSDEEWVEKRYNKVLEDNR